MLRQAWTGGHKDRGALLLKRETERKTEREKETLTSLLPGRRFSYFSCSETDRQKDRQTDRQTITKEMYH